MLNRHYYICLLVCSFVCLLFTIYPSSILVGPGSTGHKIGVHSPSQGAYTSSGGNNTI